MKRLYLAFLTFIMLSCNQRVGSEISVEMQNSNIDTIEIKNVITGEVIKLMPLVEGIQKIELDLKEPLYASIETKHINQSYLSIFTPKKGKAIQLDSNIIRTNSIVDSLLNYFQVSTIDVIRKKQNVFFSEEPSETILIVFDSLITSRQKVIDKARYEMSQLEYGILTYQNTARAYSFLFYLGRNIKKYSPRSDFFDFIAEIDNDNIYTKTLPQNLLYKYELQYLNLYDSIQSIDDFVAFIVENTTDNDLSDFLQIIYLKELIESPSYWARHRLLFNPESLKEMLVMQKNNEYYYLLEPTIHSYFSSRRGEPAFNFSATTIEGSKIKLSEFKGQLVLIDVWATWCAPCIAHRPSFLKLVDKYKNNDNIQFLMLSVDSDIDRWKNYVLKSDPTKAGIEVIIPDGLSNLLHEKYFVTGIPAYILIDDNSIIINADLPEPSIKMEKIIEEALKNK